ncbi:cupin domain-containing protein [Sinobacterium caligoides]|nr:cupin domain-containing protein [Sinobacterium caligoides]
MSEYWQKKPLLIKNAFPDWQPLISPDELAGLALEDFIESRILVGNAKFDSWQLEHGPFNEERFANLPKKHWTLLVQGVDQWSEPVADLLEEFRFAPNWRVDDVMISYAVDDASVGPHFDNYDVFLIQGLGKRRWQVGGKCDDNTPLKEHPQLKILADMETENDWILEEGDMLYIPPCYSHWGRAIGESMTYSIGYTTPTNSDIIGHLCNDYLSRCSDKERYTDPELEVTENPGEITEAALDKVKRILLSIADDETQLARAFGEMVTEAKNPDLFSPAEPISQAEMLDLIDSSSMIARNNCSKLSYFNLKDTCLLFVDGQSFDCNTQGSIQIAKQLADSGGLIIEEMYEQLNDEASTKLLIELLANDHIEFIED